MPRFALTAALALACCVQACRAQPALGADVSSLSLVEAGGGVFADAGGPRDPLAILDDAGVSLVRLRLWHTPAQGFSDLPDVLATAQRARARGMAIMLDVHFSDTWADPGQQTLPAAWSALTFTQLLDAVHDYTRDVVGAFVAQDGVAPEFVQLGNEITAGMLWPHGQVTPCSGTNWPDFAALQAAAHAGMIAGSGAAAPPLVALHIDRGADNASSVCFFDNWLAQGVAFDVIALSYYPWWHGDLDDMQSNVRDLARRYGRPVLLAEAAYPWTLGWADATTNVVGLTSQLIPPYDATVDDQVRFVRSLLSIMDAVPGELGLGVCLWEPAWIASPGAGSPFENCALFDFTGVAHPNLLLLTQPTENTDGRRIAQETLPFAPMALQRVTPSSATVLDALCVRASAQGVRIGITGTLETNEALLAVLVDTDPGGAAGQDVLDVAPAGGPLGFAGLHATTLDDGFRPDMLVVANVWNTGVFVDAYALTQGGATKTYVGRSVANSAAGDLVGGTNPDGITCAVSTVYDPGSEPDAGVEIVLPWVTLGMGATTCRSLGLGVLSVASDGRVLEQALPPLPAGSGVPGPSPDLRAIPGAQFVVVPLIRAGDANSDGVVNTEDLYTAPGVALDVDGDSDHDADDLSCLRAWLRAREVSGMVGAR